MRAAERCPEKAGGGGSSPSLATTFSNTYRQSKTLFHSGSFQNIGLSRLASRMKSSYGCFFEWLSIPKRSADRISRRLRFDATLNASRCRLRPKKNSHAAALVDLNPVLYWGRRGRASKIAGPKQGYPTPPQVHKGLLASMLGYGWIDPHRHQARHCQNL